MLPELSSSGSGHWLEKVWYRSDPPPLWLRTFSGLFGLLVSARIALYRAGWLRARHLPCPVIVIGNISVGGAGKTPLVLWLYRRLESRGWRPGVISRGYGGRATRRPARVARDSDPAEFGDEPVLLAQRGVERIAVGRDRFAAGHFLLQDSDCDIVVCDDGMQHYRLARDLEIAVLDASRGVGNGYLLPAGPLREPESRLKTVDLAVYNGGDETTHQYVMELVGNRALPVSPERGEEPRWLADFLGQPVHAVAGIGNPGRFFAMLRDSGIECTEHAFADHHAFVKSDLDFGDDAPVLMTEKDAVKCVPFDSGQLWYVPVDASPGEVFDATLQKLLADLES